MILLTMWQKLLKELSSRKHIRGVKKGRLKSMLRVTLLSLVIRFQRGHILVRRLPFMTSFRSMIRIWLLNPLNLKRFTLTNSFKKGTLGCLFCKFFTPKLGVKMNLGVKFRAIFIYYTFYFCHLPSFLKKITKNGGKNELNRKTQRTNQTI